MSRKKPKVYESGCSVCQNSKPKRIPYGSERKMFWCSKCDCALVNPVKKKTVRQKSKNETKTAIKRVKVY